MSEGSQSFTAQGSSTLDQSFEKEKDTAVVQQSTSIYDVGKAAWLTVAGTYVASFIFRCEFTDIFARTVG